MNGHGKGLFRACSRQPESLSTPAAEPLPPCARPPGGEGRRLVECGGFCRAVYGVPLALQKQRFACLTADHSVCIMGSRNSGSMARAQPFHLES